MSVTWMEGSVRRRYFAQVAPANPPPMTTTRLPSADWANALRRPTRDAAVPAAARDRKSLRVKVRFMEGLPFRLGQGFEVLRDHADLLVRIGFHERRHDPALVFPLEFQQFTRNLAGALPVEFFHLAHGLSVRAVAHGAGVGHHLDRRRGVSRRSIDERLRI